MADLSHDAADEGFHEIQLSGKQLVFLFIVTTLVSVAIFLCGVLVGRGARTARGDDQQVQTPAESAAAPTPVAESAPPAAEPPPAPAETPDELSYHKRLQAASPPAEDLKPVTREAAPPPVPRPAPPAAVVAAMPADVPSAGRPGAWVIQVQALRDRDVGITITKRLIGRGYPAFLVAPAPDTAPQLYKVHVGRYADRTEAEEVKRRLEKEEQFRPWIIR